MPVLTTERVTLEQVATATGLARTTVSDILNRDAGSRYSQATRERVAHAVRRLGYAPSRAAQQLARGRSGLIGLMLTRDFSNPFWARVANAVERELRNRKYRMQLAITDSDPAKELEQIRALKSDQVEGLVVGPVYEAIDLDIHRNVFRGQLPIVTFGGNTSCEFDNIWLDHDAGIRLALGHLMQMGHRRIGALAVPYSRLMPGVPNPDNRVMKLFHQLGILNPDWIFWQEDTGQFGDFYDCCLEFARRWREMPAKDRPTAMVCHNDQVAMTALSALSRMGIRVPQDISLIGYDNLPESVYLVPGLTTIENNAGQQMQTAVAQLLNRIKQPNAERVSIAIQPVLVERGSVAKPDVTTD